jgi:hypothetical protein
MLLPSGRSQVVVVGLSRKIAAPTSPPHTSSWTPASPSAWKAHVAYACPSDVLVGAQHGTKGVEPRLRKPSDVAKSTVETYEVITVVTDQLPSQHHVGKQESHLHRLRSPGRTSGDLAPPGCPRRVRPPDHHLNRGDHRKHGAFRKSVTRRTPSRSSASDVHSAVERIHVVTPCIAQHGQ